MSSSDIGKLLGGSIVALLGVGWCFYVPTYVRNRVADGKELAEKEASLIKGNRSVALILFAGGFVDLVEVIGNLLK